MDEKMETRFLKILIASCIVSAIIFIAAWLDGGLA